MIDSSKPSNACRARPQVTAPEENGRTATTEIEKLVLRSRQIANETNREKLEGFIYEETQRVKLKTVNTRLDAVIPLGLRLRDRPWSQTTRDDVIRTIVEHRVMRGAHLRRHPRDAPNEPLNPSTKYQWRVHITQFLKWVHDTDEAPSSCRRLPFKKHVAMVENAKHLQLRPSDVKKLLAGAQTTRDRAIIASMVECNWRASEVAALRFDKTEARDHGYWFELDPDEPDLKTGPREIPVPVIAGKRLLDEWLADHPRRHEPRGYWFVTMSKRSYGRRMTGKTVAEAVARCAGRAGLDHITAHGLRHLGVTLKVWRNVPPEVIRLVSGWTKRSNMLSHYTHAKPFVQDLLLKEHGLQSTEPELADILGSTYCLVCGEKQHVADAVDCRACGLPGSDAMKAAEAHRREDAAIKFVAYELASMLNWNASPAIDREAEAMRFLRNHYEIKRGDDMRNESFAHWCLATWASLRQQ